jgi:hypothetical protein
MFARTIAAAALSFAVLTSGSAFAASFDSVLADTKTAAVSAQLERNDRDLANNYIVMAQSLAAQGEEAKALSFLNFARGRLGLAPSDSPVMQAELSTAPFQTSEMDSRGSIR